MSLNIYSSTWFDLFLFPITEEQTQSEIAFVARQLPLPRFRRVIDLCSGPGRHANELAKLGYDITAIDIDAAAIAKLRDIASIRAIQLDMRHLDRLPGDFDAVVILWQSFGYFSAAENAEVLASIRRKLSRGGRLILDVYHREFFELHQGRREFTRDDRTITETKIVTGDRLLVVLDYGDGTGDAFDWQVFTPEQLIDFAAAAEFRPVLACSDFAEDHPPTPANPRMQLVFEAR
jgi:SAM-dependent methyltransferase